MYNAALYVPVCFHILLFSQQFYIHIENAVNEMITKNLHFAYSVFCDQIF